MRNDDVEQAQAFHSATKYYALSDSEPGDERIGIGDPASRTEAIWQKDWDIKPLLYKVYASLPPIALPRELPDTGMPALAAIAATGAAASSVVPDKALLGRLGLLTNGSLDRTWTSADGREHHYRTAGGTGALLPPRAVLRLRRSRRPPGRRLPLLRHRPHPAPGARGRLPGRARRGHRAGAVDRHRAGRAGGDEHVLAQRLALPGARLPPHLLGRRHVALAHPRRRGVGAGRGRRSCSASPIRSSTRCSTSRDARVDGGAGRARPHRRGRPPPAPAVDRLDLPTQAAVVGGGDVARAHRHAPRLVPADRRGRRAVAVAPVAAGRPPPPTGPLTELRPLPPTSSTPARRSRSSSGAARPGTTTPTSEIPFAAFSTLLDRSTRGVRLRRARAGRAAHRPLPDRQRRRGPGAGRLPASSAARRRRAPPRGHLPRRGHPHRGRPAAMRATRT